MDQSRGALAPAALPTWMAPRPKRSLMTSTAAIRLPRSLVSGQSKSSSPWDIVLGISKKHHSSFGELETRLVDLSDAHNGSPDQEPRVRSGSP